MSALDALFRDEVERQAAVLRDGLRACSYAPPEGDMLFAAQALKGAARVVGVHAAERLADALESALGAAEAGKRVLTAAQLMACDAAITLLEDLAQAGIESAEELAPSGKVDGIVKPLAATSRSATTQAPRVRHASLDSFRTECELHAATLSDGLLALERDPSQVEVIDRMMRAAHSIKGAARVVGLDAAVALAHAVEDRLIAVQRGEVAVDPMLMETLFAANDLLQQIALATAPGARAAPPSESQVLGCAERVLLAGRASRPEMSGPAASVEADTVGAGKNAAVPPRSDTAADIGIEQDRVLKVRASQLSRLVALSSELLVEARRLRPFVATQQRLRSRQSGFVDLLNDLHRALGSPQQDHPVGARIAELRTRLNEARLGVSTWIEDFEEYVRRSEELTMRLFRESADSRMRPLADGLAPFPRLVRDVAKRLGKKAELVIVGEAHRIDRDILERIEAPLGHLLRNAIDHGLEAPDVRLAAGKPERGAIRLEARAVSGSIEITVSDDGAGIDLDKVRQRVAQLGQLPAESVNLLDEDRLLDHLFTVGFSTADQVTDISGRGIGLDVVQSVLREVGGSVHASTRRGHGTRFHLRVPVSRSVLRAVVVNIAGEPYAFPLTRVDRLLRVPYTDLRQAEDREYVIVGDSNVALVPAAQILELGGEPPSDNTLEIVVVSDRTHRIGFVVDRLLGEHDLVVRPLDPRLGRVADLSAAAILPDGTPVLIIDTEDMVRSVLRLQQTQRFGKLHRASAVARRRRRVLVADDSFTVREVERELLEGSGYEVVTVADGMEAWRTVRESHFDLVITDVEMPRLDGFALTRSIKQDGRLSGTPVVIVSYRNSAEDVQRGLAAAADHYVSKADFDGQALLQAVSRLIGPAQI